MSAPLPGPLETSPLISDWLGFEDGRIRLYSGRVELGQGNLTALLQLAADELDVDPGRIDITGGDTRLTPNEGFTAGSMSMPIGGRCVRLAASAARHVLLAEAAKLLQRRPTDLTLEDGTVFTDERPTDLDLWTLAQTLSLDLPITEHAAPKPPEARRLSGTSLPRIDLAPRITAAPFVHDLAPDGMLHGRPVHPPSMLGRLDSLDLEALRARPGVTHVIRDGSFVGLLAVTEPAAIAAAAWAREHATWTGPDAPEDPVAQIRTSTEAADIIHATGDPAAEGQTFETTVTRPYLSHGSIGPSCALALWSEDRLTVWSHTQGVFPLRAALSDVFAILPEAIDVIHRPGAGCYGHNGADDAALDAALLARAVPGRPVRVLWSRADEFRHAPLGPAMATHATATVSDGRITSMRVTANSAPHGNRPGRNGAPNLRAAAYLEQPFPVPRSADIPPANGGGADRNSVPYYDIPNLEVTKRVVHELPWRTSSMRGLGAFCNVFGIETLIDDIAHAIGADPVVFRLAHLADPRARTVIERVAEAADWPPQRAEGIGHGLAFARYKNTAAYCAVIVRAEVDETVRLTHAWAQIDAGEAINPDGIVNQTEGGIIQAASWTLKEALRLDGPAVATATWEDYPILTFPEIPEISVGVISHPDQPPLGCAEAAAGPTAAAIGNAVLDALGVRVRDLPITRDAIVAAMA